jgi:signal peptidase II
MPEDAQPPSSDDAPQLSRYAIWVHTNRVVFLLLTCVLWVGLDQATKVWAQDALALERPRIEKTHIDGQLVEQRVMRFYAQKPQVVIPGVLNFKYAENEAAAFSLTRSLPDWFRRPFLLLFSLLAMVLIGGWYFRMKKPDGLLMSAFALILAGAFGNMIDRVRLAYVIDFIDVYAGFLEGQISPRWVHWPTFNIADSCIVVGALLVVYRTLRPLYPEDDDEPTATSVDEPASDAA